MVQVVIAFDKEFQDQPDEIIFQTILAANFLDIKNLLELMCKKVLTVSSPTRNLCRQVPLSGKALPLGGQRVFHCYQNLRNVTDVGLETALESTSSKQVEFCQRNGRPPWHSSRWWLGGVSQSISMSACGEVRRLEVIGWLVAGRLIQPNQTMAHSVTLMGFAESYRDALLERKLAPQGLCRGPVSRAL